MTITSRGGLFLLILIFLIQSIYCIITASIIMANKNELKHIAFIMDGNGRWAKARHLPRHLGHKAGCERVTDVYEARRRRCAPTCGRRSARRSGSGGCAP